MNFPQNTVNMKIDPTQLSDQELYDHCVHIGNQALFWKRNFGVLLPEVNRRSLYSHYGFVSIFHFGAVLGGLSKSTVQEILRIDQRLTHLPLLKNLLQSGQVGWSKLKVVLSATSSKNEAFWAEQLKILSKTALGQLVQDLKKQEEGAVQNGSPEKEHLANSHGPVSERTKKRERNCHDYRHGNGEGKGDSDREKLPQDPDPGRGDYKNHDLFTDPATPTDEKRERSPRMLTMQITPLIKHRIDVLRKKLEKEEKRTLSFSQVMEMLLDGFRTTDKNVPHYDEVITLCPECRKHHMKTTAGKIEITEEALAQRSPKGEPIILEDAKAKVQMDLQDKKTTRYIPASVRKFLHLQYGGICAFPGCHLQAEILHHTRRFSLHPGHEPDHLVPLCKSHEAIAHAGLIQDEEKDSLIWRLDTNSQPVNNAKNQIDKKVQAYRRKTAEHYQLS
jgi:hypothetical protein